MNLERLQTKLNILADAAKYDVSCASSGSNRANRGGLGNGSMTGICHSYTEDGRCVSLLKILLTNHCIYDCAYCVSRSTNAIQRAAFTVEEVVDLTINFYRRNYIEGLFLSSGIFNNADHTMERLVRVAKTLRLEHNFNGYIHLKLIPKASPELVRVAGLYADRLSVNMEIPTASGLKLLAPEKKHEDMMQPMVVVRDQLAETKENRKRIKTTPKFARAGQSTQLIIGAARETDLQVIRAAERLYRSLGLRRVYYSGYVPMLADKRLPALDTSVPTVRENRLYQADWLMRFYGYRADEIVESDQPFLDLKMDPKLAWAMRHRDRFPVVIQHAPLEMILRIPGIGVRSAHKIVQARRFQKLTLDHLRLMGAALNRAKYFLSVSGGNPHLQHLDQSDFTEVVINASRGKNRDIQFGQLSLF
jgi:putative DNA modification/repair radical SAM protein